MSEQATVMVPLRDGAELWTTVSGIGPPLVCLHGGPGLWDYLAPLAALLDDTFMVVRFDQRGCGRSSGHDGPFTIEQAVDDLEQVRAALGFDRWAVVGHSWGADLAIHYAARHPDRTVAAVYIAGVGAGNEYRDAYHAERKRRLRPDRARWEKLSAIPDGERTPDQERKLCLLQWRTDFSPTPIAAGHAYALWETRPAGAEINYTANRELWKDRENEDILLAATRVTCPVLMYFGTDDPRPWSATDSLSAALPRVAARVFFDGAGHLPWAERPAELRQAILEGIQYAVYGG